MRKLLFPIIVMFIFSSLANAKIYDFVVDGIAYRILDVHKMEVEVVNNNDNTIKNPNYGNGYQYEASSYSGDIVIPSTVNYGGKTFKVVSVGLFAFSECKDMLSIVLPNTISTIGIGAFQECDGLKDFSWPSSANSVPNSAFYSCNNLESISLPEGVDSICNTAFCYCSKLKVITIPSSLKYIGGRIVFAGTLIERIELPEGLEYVGDPTISHVNSGTFANMEHLRTIIMPSTIKKIGSYSFTNCPNLETIVCKSSESIKYANAAFYNSYGISYLIVPKGCEDKFADWPTKYVFGYDKDWSFNNIGNIVEQNGLLYHIVEDGATKSVYLSNIKDINTTTITIPNAINAYNGTYNVKGILNKVSECTELRSVYINISDPIIIDETTFSNVTYLVGCLYVPIGSKANYQNAIGWKNFNTIIETDSFDNLYAYYSFNVSSTLGGNVSVLGNTLSNTSMSATVKEGDKVTLSFTPDDGYELKSVVVNGVDVTMDVVDNSYTIQSVSQNTTVEVIFAELPVYLTIKSDENGVLTQEVEKGKEYTFTLATEEGWEIGSIYFNGNDVTSSIVDNKYTTPKISQNSELSVVYKTSPFKTTIALLKEDNDNLRKSLDEKTSEIALYAAGDLNRDNVVDVNDLEYLLKSSSYTGSVSDIANLISENTTLSEIQNEIPDAEFYKLDGTKVDQPDESGIYLIKINGKTVKIVVKK